MTTAPQLISGNAGLLAFQDVINNTACQTAAGCCYSTTDSSFTDKVNDVIQRLMIRGDWPGTLLPIQITVTPPPCVLSSTGNTLCPQPNIITMPRIVGSVRAFNICRSGIPVQGVWATFLDHYWRSGSCCGAWQNWIEGRPKNLTQFGTGVQFAPIPTSTCVLKVYSDPTDSGDVIQFFGLNPTGGNLTTPVAAFGTNPASIAQGISITLNQPFTVDSNLVASISRVIKPITNAPVQISAIDTTTGIETPIAAFDAGDTNPSFAQYKLHGYQCCSSTPPTLQSIALCKLKYIPVVAPTDLITIPNLSVIAMMLKAVRFQEAGDRANFLGYQADAVKELNLQLGDSQPDYQIPININPYGSATPSRAAIGRLR